MNNTLNKKTPAELLKNFVSDNKVILMFIVLSVVCILISGANVSYVAGEVFSRFGRNTCLVLALIIPCMAGLGMNFGIVVGAIAAQISIFWIVHWGFVGVPGFLLCVLMSTPLALLFGWLTGMLFNKTKGSEMVAGLVLGFFAAGLYRLFTLYIMGGVIPYDDPNLLDRGFGLRNAFDLSGNLKYAVDDISFLSTLSVMGVVYILYVLIAFLHGKKTGEAVDTKKTGIQLAIGAVIIVFGIVGKMIPPVANMLGKNRVILADAALLLSIGLLIYAAVLFLKNKPAKGTAAFNKVLKVAVLAVVLLVTYFVPFTNKV